VSTAIEPSPVTAEEWPQQDQAQHPFDDEPATDRHQRGHRQSSQDTTVTGMGAWKRFRAANFRSASESWTGQAAWLRVNGGSAQEVAAADFHAQRFARQAEVYGRKAS
jgi:hypothetical protein